MDECDRETIEDMERLNKLYCSLSEEDRRYVVARWDEENELEGWHERLEKKKNRPMHVKQIETYIFFGVIVLSAIGIYIGYEIGWGKGRDAGYQGCRSNLEVAIENYPAGLQRTIMSDLKNQEEAILDLMDR